MANKRKPAQEDFNPDEYANEDFDPDEYAGDKISADDGTSHKTSPFEETTREITSWLPATGMVGGALFGSPGGPAGAILGAGAGRAGGKEIEDIINEKLFGQKEKSTGDKFLQAGGEFLTGSGAEFGGQAIAKGVGYLGQTRPGQFVKRGFTKGVETLTGIPKQEWSTYIGRHPQIQKNIKTMQKDGTDIPKLVEESGQGAVNVDLNQYRQAQNKVISDVISSSKSELPVRQGNAPFINAFRSLEEAKAGLDPRIPKDAQSIKEINSLMDDFRAIMMSPKETVSGPLTIQELKQALYRKRGYHDIKQDLKFLDQKGFNFEFPGFTGSKTVGGESLESIPLQTADRLRSHLEEIASPAYNKDSNQVFYKLTDDSVRAARKALESVKESMYSAEPALGEAFGNLSKVHKSLENVPSYLTAPGGRTSGFLKAGHPGTDEEKWLQGVAESMRQPKQKYTDIAKELSATKTFKETPWSPQGNFPQKMVRTAGSGGLLYNDPAIGALALIAQSPKTWKGLIDASYVAGRFSPEAFATALSEFMKEKKPYTPIQGE